MRKLMIFTLAAGLPATMALAQSAEDAAKARRGFFQLVGFEMGGLAAMARGRVDYDADAALGHAADLSALASYDLTGLFPEGSSNEDLPGETRALPVIWEDMAGLGEKAAAFSDAVANLAATAGDGQAALGQAVGQLGGTCKSCHDEFRASSF